MNGPAADLYYFDTDAADRVVNWIEANIVHTDDKWRGKPFVLLAWQRQIIRDLFGWKVTATGLRRYKQAYIEVPKKNGKSPLAAVIALVCMFMTKDASGRVYSCATKRDQAAIVWDYAERMLRASPTLRKHIGTKKTLNGNAITIKRNPRNIQIGSAEFKPLSSDANTEDGLNANVVIIDELHRSADASLFNLMQGSMLAKEDGLMITITTAGDDVEGVCYKQRCYAEAINIGLATDDSFYGVIYAAEAQDDPYDQKTWFKANPSLGDIISVDNFAKLAEKAKQLPSYRYDFFRYHLNIWNQKKDAFIPDERWMRNAAPVDTAAIDAGASCYVGVDLANTEDFAAVVQLFPHADGTYSVVPHIWIPEAAVRDHGQADLFKEWSDEGLITIVDGEKNDYAVIEQYVLDLHARNPVIQLGFDRKDATQMAQRWRAEGIDCWEMPQTWAGLHGGMTELERLTIDSKLRHNGHRALRWMVGNMVAKPNSTGMIMPDHIGRANKNDAGVALVMAVGRAMLKTDVKKASVYEERGLVTF